MGSIYVGGVRISSGSWVWLDGLPVDTSLWYPGEPQDIYGTHTCLRLWWEQGSSYEFLLDDNTCTSLEAFLCEI